MDSSLTLEDWMTDAWKVYLDMFPTIDDDESVKDLWVNSDAEKLWKKTCHLEYDDHSGPCGEDRQSLRRLRTKMNDLRKQTEEFRKRMERIPSEMKPEIHHVSEPTQHSMPEDVLRKKVEGLIDEWKKAVKAVQSNANFSTLTIMTLSASFRRLHAGLRANSGGADGHRIEK